MKKESISKFFLLLLLTIAISGCGAASDTEPTLDPVAVMTQVAGTVQAEITQAALLSPEPTIAPPLTATPLPIPTLPLPAAPTTSTNGPAPAPVLPGESPDNAILIEDVSVPDDTVYSPGNRFTKTWKIENTGTTTWDINYFFRYLDGQPIMADESDMVIFLTNPVEPNNQVTLSVRMTAPSEFGSYTNWFKMSNSEGQLFGDSVFVRITVGEITPTPEG